MDIETPKTLKRLIELIIEDENILNNDVFTKIFNIAATEWCNFVMTFNGGNTVGYNLRRSGKIIESIYHTCATQDVQKPRIKIIWECVLHDLNKINEICDFELNNNVLIVHPHQKFIQESYNHDEKKSIKYKLMPREKKDNWIS
jgi:hypothetical protein